jgi:hypothetical protein
MKSALFPLVLLIGTALSQAQLTNKVLIIGIDGTMISALAVARTPNLEALKSNGCYTVRAVTHPVTHSAACWSSMFTGVWGDKHLVNDPNNSFTGNNFARYPSFFQRLETFNANLNTVCFARWAPLLTVVPEADVKTAFSSDAAITVETCRQLTNGNSDVLYTILLDVDSAGHSYGWGPTITNYVKAIETADGQVGEMIKALYARRTYTNENWLVIVLTDHGEHDNPDPEKSRVTWHIVAGPSAARGVMWPSPSIVDLCATVLTHIGVPIDPAWNLDARLEGFPLPPTRYGTNLIFNGDADAISGADNYATNRGIAWWFDISSTTLGMYGSNANFPSLTAPGPENRGTNFFLGGTTNGFITQRIDLSDLSGDVDDPGIKFGLSGWFGGAATDGDYANLTANFLNASGGFLGFSIIGNVTPDDRAGITGLLERTANGTLPVGTRFVEFALTNRVVSGRNDASADNLSFVLEPIPDPPFAISAPVMTPDGYALEIMPTSTNRVYVLERSADLDAWSEITAPARGSGGPVLLLDTNPPATGAYYRGSRRGP